MKGLKELFIIDHVVRSTTVNNKFQKFLVRKLGQVPIASRNEIISERHNWLKSSDNLTERLSNRGSGIWYGVVVTVILLQLCWSED